MELLLSNGTFIEYNKNCSQELTIKTFTYPFSSKIGIANLNEKDFIKMSKLFRTIATAMEKDIFPKA